MSGISVLLPILTAGVTAILAWRIWQHDQTSPSRRKEFLVFLGALVVAITSAIAAVVEWADGVRADAENRGRFETQLTRLDTLVKRTRQISVSSHALADSLRLTLEGVSSGLAHQRVQILQQRRVLASIETGAAIQAQQLVEQQSLVRSQQRLIGQGWRESYPLDFPIGVYVKIQYSADQAGLGEFIDSLEVKSRRIIASATDSIRAVQRSTGPLGLSHTMSGGDQGQAFDRLEFRLADKEVRPETLRLYRNSGWVRNWHHESDKWFLTAAAVDGRIANVKANPPLELRFSADADSSDAVFQLDRNLSPMSPFSITIEFEKRTITQRMASRDAFVSFRSAALSLLDLPCGTIRLTVGPTSRPDAARSVEAKVFFGFSEYQWQLHVPATRFARAGSEEWQADLRAADLFQSVWSEDGWSRHNGQLNVEGLSRPC